MTDPSPVDGQSNYRSVVPQPPVSPVSGIDQEEIQRRLELNLLNAVREEGILVSPEKGKRIAHVVATQTITETAYEGPIPPPKTLRDFDNVVPGLAREIADSAWREQRHRHRWESGALLNDIFMQSGGLFLGWLLAGACSVGYFFLVYNHYPALAASPLLGPPILTIARTMLPGWRSERSAADKKPKDGDETTIPSPTDQG